MAIPHITDVKGIGQSTAEILSEHDVFTVEDLARIDIDLLIAIPGFSGIRAAKIINEAQALLGAVETMKAVPSAAMESSDREEPATAASVADEEEPEKLKSPKKMKKGKQAKKPNEKKKKKLKPEKKKKSGKGKKSKTKDKKKK
jgi:transcription termination factor NusA